MAKRLPKKPRKPKASASVAAWERFDARVHDWKMKVSHIHSQAKKKEHLMKKYAHGIDHVTRRR